MRRIPAVLLSTLALLCWCAALFWGQSVAGHASGVLVRWTGEEGPTAADLTRIRRYALEDGAQSPPSADLWRERPGLTISLEEGGRSWTGPVLELFGDGGRVWPTTFLAGGYPAQGDTEGVAVDETVAHALWGSTDVLGAQVSLEGRTYFVRGVFRGGGLALFQGTEGGTARYENLLLTFPQGGSQDLAKQWLTAARLPQGTVVDLPLWSWLLGLCAALPGLLLGLGCLMRLFRRGCRLRHTPLLLGAYLLPALGAGGLLLWAMGFPPAIPVRLIPTKWSNFDFWGQLWTGLGEELQGWLTLPPGRLELEVWLPALGCVICAVAASGLTVLAAERVRAVGGRQTLLTCAAALGLTYACAMVFAGAGGVVLGRGVWLLPSLFAAQAWALDCQAAALMPVREEETHEKAA